MEALAQEHFNYIAEGGSPPGQPLSDPLPHSRRQRPSWRDWLQWSPRAAMSVATLLLTLVLARQLKEQLVDVLREVFTRSDDAGGASRASVEGGGRR